ncbi:MAG: hypothetical protein ACRDHN_15770, partial [Thermomicrobiales bacterium]
EAYSPRLKPNWHKDAAVDVDALSPEIVFGGEFVAKTAHAVVFAGEVGCTFRDQSGWSHISANEPRSHTGRT